MSTSSDDTSSDSDNNCGSDCDRVNDSNGDDDDDDNRSKTVVKRCRFDAAFFENFHRYDDIQLWMRNLVDEHPQRVRLEIIGKSLQNRDIYMVVLKECARLPKISVLVEGGIHAREWISPATVLYFVYNVLLDKDILQHADLYVIPCLNPDGYEYTHTCMRLWRKNMNKNGFKSKEYWGVDINRNFPYGYGLTGSSSSPASLTYRGRHCLSEPEAQCLANVLNKYGRYIHLFVAMHAYGNMIMYPWGFTSKPVPDECDLKKCAKVAADAIKSVYPKSCYKIGKLSDVLYLSSGGSSDFARGVHKIKFSYTIELQRSGASGFDPCPSKIVPIGEEVILALEAMIKHVYDYYKCKKRKKSPNCQSYCEQCKRFKRDDSTPRRSCPRRCERSL